MFSQSSFSFQKSENKENENEDKENEDTEKEKAEANETIQKESEVDEVSQFLMFNYTQE